MEPKIQVVILNYKTFDLTITYVKTLQHQKEIELSVLIVDNNSENKSYEILVEYFKCYENVDVIKSQYNGGYAYGNNVGFEYLKDSFYDYLLVSNNDIVLNSNSTLFRMASLYEMLETPAFASPVQTVDGEQYSPAWKLPTIWYDIFTNIPIINNFFLKRNQYQWLKNQIAIPVDVLPGSFFFSKKEVIYRVGLLDQNTFLYGEERILACKVKREKLQNYLLTELEYEHKPSSTISSHVTKLKMLTMAHESIVFYHKAYLNTPFFLIKMLMFLHQLVRSRYQ